MNMRTALITLALIFLSIGTALGEEREIARFGISEYSITVPDPSSSGAMLAASEIKAYLRRISGAVVPVRAGEGDANKTIVITRDPRQEGFAVAIDGPRITITGGSDAEVLNAAYWFLDKLGCRFLAPQFSHYRDSAEVVPSTHVLTFDLRQPFVTKPKLAYRKLYIEEGISHDEANLKQLIEWMPKVGYNVLVCPMDYGNRGRVKWDNWRDALTPELQKRGITIEVGGHGYENFINADMEGGKLCEQHPEWFGQDEKGTRRKLKSQAFCTSNAQAVEYVTKNFLDYVAKRPEIQIFDFWPPDGARWCECDKCKALGEPPERQAKLISHVSREVAKVRPDLKLEAIAYSKLIDPPKAEKIDKSVLIDFCPIAQNFEFTIDDPAGHGTRADGGTPVANKQYFDALQDWRKRFEGPISIYSYYRRYAWDSLPVMSPWHMSHEMKWYASIPTQGISTYSEPGDWFAYELNHYVLPALAWDPDRNVDRLVDDFCSARYGGEAGGVARSTFLTLSDVVRTCCSVPFVSLKSERQIELSQIRLDQAAKEIDAKRNQVSDELTKRHLERLGLVVAYVLRDLEVQKMLAANAPREQIRQRVAADHKWLSDHANDGWVLVKGNRLTLERAYARYGVKDKSTTAPAE